MLLPRRQQGWRQGQLLLPPVSPRFAEAMDLLCGPRPGGPYTVRVYRVSATEQGHSGLGLEAQQASVRA